MVAAGFCSRCSFFYKFAEFYRIRHGKDGPTPLGRSFVSTSVMEQSETI
jgi:hypothetical protein